MIFFITSGTPSLTIDGMSTFRFTLEVVVYFPYNISTYEVSSLIVDSFKFYYTTFCLNVLQFCSLFL